MRTKGSRLVNGLEVAPPTCFHGGEYQKVFFSCPIHRKPSISYRKIRLFRNFQIKGVFPTLNRSCVVLAPCPILSDIPLCLTSRLFVACSHSPRKKYLEFYEQKAMAAFSRSAAESSKYCPLLVLIDYTNNTFQKKLSHFRKSCHR